MISLKQVYFISAQNEPCITVFKEQNQQNMNFTQKQLCEYLLQINTLLIC